MVAPYNKKYFIISIIFHVIVMGVLIFSIDFSSPLAVIENTNQHDVISAVVLGDTAKSKILPDLSQPKPQPVIKKVEPQKDSRPLPKKQTVSQVETKKDVIALEAKQKKKKAQDKALAEKRRRELFGKELLADIKKVHDKQKKIKQKQLQAEFQKMLHEQTEKSLRQQLLNEDIKLRGTQSRLSQGEVNKYKALIMQAISEHWIIPTQANKKSYCELMIRVAPGGVVLDVQVTKSSGDPSLDSSARAAVLKASPLPVPKDADTFAPFRQFVLKAKPENIIASDAFI